MPIDITCRSIQTYIHKKSKNRYTTQPIEKDCQEGKILFDYSALKRNQEEVRKLKELFKAKNEN